MRETNIKPSVIKIHFFFIPNLLFYDSIQEPVYFTPEACLMKTARSFLNLMMEGLWMYIM
jgi:hypothetical protein